MLSKLDYGQTEKNQHQIQSQIRRNTHTLLRRHAFPVLKG